MIYVLRNKRDFFSYQYLINVLSTRINFHCLENVKTRVVYLLYIHELDQ